MNYEEQILETWHQNAVPWEKAIAGNEIESRKLVTNQAILDTIVALTPKKVWDIGCGEGWLCRRLNEHGIACIGTDAIPELVNAAKHLSGDWFEILPYENITTDKASSLGADLFVFNFSLFGEKSVESLLGIIKPALPLGGHLVIQTLHPFSAVGDEPYKSGWRKGSWNGFSTEFVNPAPWYFRTMGNWHQLISNSGFAVINISEPLNPETGSPASLIITASRA